MRRNDAYHIELVKAHYSLSAELRELAASRDSEIDRVVLRKLAGQLEVDGYNLIVSAHD